MDRYQILEDLKDWLQGYVDFGDVLDAEDVLERISFLEELYE